MYYCSYCKTSFSVSLIHGTETVVGACPYCSALAPKQSKYKLSDTAKAMFTLEPSNDLPDWWTKISPSSQVNDLLLEYVKHGPLVQEPKNRVIRRKGSNRNE